MRKNRAGTKQNDFRILALDDDEMMTLALQTYFHTSGYQVDIENDPVAAIERLRGGQQYDILLLDFLMSPICGDEVVSRIREFDKEMYIILLTGHKSLAPPIKTIRELDIQGYYEKSERFDQLELLVESCVKSIKQVRTIRGYHDGLKDIVDSNSKIYKLQTMDELLQTLSTQAGRIFGKADGFIYVKPYLTNSAEADEEGRPLPKDYYYGVGTYSNNAPYAKGCLLRLLNGETTEAITSSSDIKYLGTLIDEKGHIIGVFGAEKPEKVTKPDLRLFDLYVKQASSAVSNVMLNGMVNVKNKELQAAYEKLNKNYYDMVSTVRYMVDARDIYTRGHSDRVSHYSILIAREMGMDEGFTNRIGVAGLFHDIGKISVPDSILLKSTKLTDDEYASIKEHTISGYNILSAVSVFQDIAAIVIQHHEHMDGKGYPAGLKGDEISMEARIIGVADAFDAMMSDRLYRKSLNVSAAINELVNCKNAQFDPNVVDAFMRILKDYDRICDELEWTYSKKVIPKINYTRKVLNQDE